MKIASLDYSDTATSAAQPLGPADPLKVELFRAAMNAPSPGGGAVAAAQSGDQGEPGSGQTLGQILRSMRSSAAAVSNDWQQTRASMSDLMNSSILEPDFIPRMRNVLHKTTSNHIKLDFCTKIAGKCTHTLDTLSRG